MLQTLINLARPLFLSVFPQQEALSIEQINNAVTRLLKYVFALMISSALLIIILTFLIDRTLNQLDSGVYRASPSMTLLSVLLIIDGAVLAVLLLKDSPKPPTTAPATRPSPLEHAVSVLILDIVNERKQERRERSHNPNLDDE